MGGWGVKVVVAGDDGVLEKGVVYISPDVHEVYIYTPNSILVLFPVGIVGMSG